MMKRIAKPIDDHVYRRLTTSVLAAEDARITAVGQTAHETRPAVKIIQTTYVGPKPSSSSGSKPAVPWTVSTAATSASHPTARTARNVVRSRPNVSTTNCT